MYADQSMRFGWHPILPQSHGEGRFLCPYFGRAQTLLAGGISGVRLPRVTQVAFVIASLAQWLRRGEQQSKQKRKNSKVEIGRFADLVVSSASAALYNSLGWPPRHYRAKTDENRAKNGFPARCAGG